MSIAEAIEQLSYGKPVVNYNLVYHRLEILLQQKSLPVHGWELYIEPEKYPQGKELYAFLRNTEPWKTEYLLLPWLELPDDKRKGYQQLAEDYTKLIMERNKV